MKLFENMYEHTEMTDVHFVGFHTDHVRYDFGIVYTNRFFGNPLVFDLQTGRVYTMCAFDASNKTWIQETFHTPRDEDTEGLILFFKNYIPSPAHISEM